MCCRYEDHHLQLFFHHKAKAIIQDSSTLEKSRAVAGAEGSDSRHSAEEAALAFGTPVEWAIMRYRGLNSGKNKREKQAILSQLADSVAGGGPIRCIFKASNR